MMTLAQAAAWMAQTLPQVQYGSAAAAEGAQHLALQRVHTDSRSVQPGDLFIALRGERLDAHDFLAQAQAAGAAAAVVELGRSLPGLPCLEVSDTTAALGALAAGWRSQFGLPLVAVTGSNGKTTVTQMLASILTAAAGEAAFATRGNFNNAQREHLEFMHTVQAVAEENGSVLAMLPMDGTAVFPADDAFTPLWQGLAAGRTVLTFGAGVGDVQASHAVWQGDHWQVSITTPHGPLHTALHIAGRHNVRNALAATACAVAAGVPLAAIAQGLQAFTPVTGRSRALALPWQGRTLTLVDDTYNANPDSVRAVIDVLAELPGPRLLVLGDMGEVGDQGPAFHAEVGAYARERGIERLLAHGPQAIHAAMAFGGGRHFDDMAALTDAVRTHLSQCASIAVKGSRFMRMERVVDALSAPVGGEAEGARAA